MISAALTLSPPQPIAFAAPTGRCAPPAVSGAVVSVAACESCRQVAATCTVAWPDARFQVCRACLPADVVSTIASAPPTERTTRPAAGLVVPPPSDPAPVCSPTPTLSAVPVRPAPVASMPPVTLSSGPDRAERQVLERAARDVRVSRPAPRGLRLDAAGGCDVVAAVTLAAGGEVDELGQPVPPSERAGAVLLRRVLARVADQLAGWPVRPRWDDDPIALIDAWQSHPALSRAQRADLLEAAGRLPVTSRALMAGRR